MRLITIVLAILILGAACAEKVPEDVVSKKQMGALLLDMHLADGRLASMLTDSARMYRDMYYESIFDRYAIDSATFEKSVEFYAARPKLMKAFYIDIERQLEAYNLAEQQAIDEKYKLQRKADSIANVRRTDSLQKTTRDSLDLKRKRYLLYLNGPDSLRYGQPVPVTYRLLTERMLEALGHINVNPLDSVNTQSVRSVVPPVLPTPAVNQHPLLESVPQEIK